MKKKIVLVLVSVALVSMVGCKKKKPTLNSSSSSSSGSSSVVSSIDNSKEAYIHYHSAMALIKSHEGDYSYKGTIKEFRGDKKELKTNLEENKLYSSKKNKFKHSLKGTKEGNPYSQLEMKYEYSGYDLYSNVENDNGKYLYDTCEFKEYTDDGISSLITLFEAYSYISASTSLEIENEWVNSYFYDEKDPKNYEISLNYESDNDTLIVDFDITSKNDESYVAKEQLSFRNDQLYSYTFKEKINKGETKKEVEKKYKIYYTSQDFELDYSSEEKQELENNIIPQTRIRLALSESYEDQKKFWSIDHLDNYVNKVGAANVALGYLDNASKLKKYSDYSRENLVKYMAEYEDSAVQLVFLN